MPNGKQSETLSATAPVALARQIEKLAFDSGLSRSRYILALLEEAARNCRIFRFARGQFIEEPPGAPVIYRLNETPNTKRK